MTIANYDHGNICTSGVIEIAKWVRTKKALPWYTIDKYY